MSKTGSTRELRFENEDRPRKGRHVPIYFDTNGLTSGVLQKNQPRHASMSAIERHMEAEVEKAINKPLESSSKLKGFKMDSFHLRSGDGSDSGGDHRRRRRVVSTPLAANRHISIPEIDIIRRENANMNTSTESLNDEDKRPLYVRCPDTGQKIFKMEFNVKGYSEDNINVKVTDGKLIVHAVQKETVDGRETTNEFCRKIKLPADIVSEKLLCKFVDEKLVVESPLKSSPVSPDGSLSSISAQSECGSLSPGSSDLINEPYIRPHPGSPTKAILHLNVQVGCVFQANDVTVKVKGQDKICIYADRQEENTRSRLSAQLTREIDLPSKINPRSLEAGLTMAGILKISAEVDEKTPVTVVISPADDTTNDSPINADKNLTFSSDN